LCRQRGEIGGGGVRVVADLAENTKTKPLALNPTVREIQEELGNGCDPWKRMGRWKAKAHVEERIAELVLGPLRRVDAKLR